VGRGEFIDEDGRKYEEEWREGLNLSRVEIKKG
jgi:hypothetical protein